MRDPKSQLVLHTSLGTVAECWGCADRGGRSGKGDLRWKREGKRPVVVAGQLSVEFLPGNVFCHTRWRWGHASWVTRGFGPGNDGMFEESVGSRIARGIVDPSFQLKEKVSTAARGRKGELVLTTTLIELTD